MFFPLRFIWRHPRKYWTVETPLNLEFLASEARPLRHGLEFLPYHFGVHLGLVASLRRESAIRAGDHVFTAHQPPVPDQSLGDPLRMLDDIARVSNNARHQHLPGRKPNRLKHMVLMLMTRVCCLKRVVPRLYLDHVTNDVLECRVEHVRPFVDAVAGVEAYFFLGYSAEGVIQCLDEHVRLLLALRRVVPQVWIDIGQKWVV